MVKVEYTSPTLPGIALRLALEPCPKNCNQSIKNIYECKLQTKVESKRFAPPSRYDARSNRIGRLILAKLLMWISLKVLLVQKRTSWLSEFRTKECWAIKPFKLTRCSVVQKPTVSTTRFNQLKYVIRYQHLPLSLKIVEQIFRNWVSQWWEFSCQGNCWCCLQFPLSFHSISLLSSFMWLCLMRKTFYYFFFGISEKFPKTGWD